MSRRGDPPGLFDEIAWERFLRIVVVIAFATTTFAFTAAEVLPPRLSTIAIGAIGSVALVTAIIGFLIGAASTLDHAEARASAASTPTTNREEQDGDHAESGDSASEST